jgi:hypothetical protein
MPYIRGRYYMNPVVGDALEAAREAEAALQALEHAAKVARGDTGEDDPGSSNSSGSGNGASGSSNASGSDANSSADAYAKAAPGPIHRVEIEAAELVPAHSGRAQRGWRRRCSYRRRPAGAVAFGFQFAIREQLLEATKRNALRPRNPRLLQSQRPNQFPPRPIRRRF